MTKETHHLHWYVGEDPHQLHTSPALHPPTLYSDDAVVTHDRLVVWAISI